MRRDSRRFGCIASRNTTKIPLKSGNANLPIGGLRHANREIGVPRKPHMHAAYDAMFVVHGAGKAYDSRERDSTKSDRVFLKGHCHEGRRSAQLPSWGIAPNGSARRACSGGGKLDERCGRSATRCTWHTLRTQNKRGASNRHSRSLLSSKLLRFIQFRGSTLQRGIPHDRPRLLLQDSR